MSHREAKIIASVPCPTCGAQIAMPCRIYRGRPMVCTSRKAAWQQIKDARPPDYIISYLPEGPHGARTSHCALLAPQSAAALQALRGIAPDGEWIGGALRVRMRDMPAVVRQLVRAGWRTANSDSQI